MIANAMYLDSVSKNGSSEVILLKGDNIRGNVLAVLIIFYKYINKHYFSTLQRKSVQMQ